MLMALRLSLSTLLPYTTLFRSLFIVTKGDSGSVALYRVASQFRDGLSVTLERVSVLVPAAANDKHPVVERTSRVTDADASADRSEEHTSELQSHLNLVCRLLLE